MFNRGLHGFRGFLTATNFALLELVAVFVWSYPAAYAGRFLFGLSDGLRCSAFVVTTHLGSLIAATFIQRTGELGFEPRLSDSESLVLPLHYSPISLYSKRTYGTHPQSLGQPDR